MRPSGSQISSVPFACFFFALLFLPISAPAQVDVNVGIDGGLTSMTRGGETASKFGLGRRVGFTIGGFAVVDFAGPIGLRPRIGYIQKGSTSSSETEIRDERGNLIRSGRRESTARYDYIELSVPIGFQIPISDHVIPRLFAGPFLGRNVKAETELVEPDGTVRVFDSDSVRDYQVGLVFIGGLNFGLAGSELSIDVRYHFGLSDIQEARIGTDDRVTETSLISFDPAERNQGVTFALGVSF